MLLRAQRHQAAGEWVAAAAVYADLARQYPHDHRLLANQGNALWLADLPAAANHAYGRALSLKSDCTVSQRGLASCLRDLNQFEAALSLHRRLETVLERRSPDGLSNLWAHSQVLIGLQRYGEAFRRMALRRARAPGHELAPWNPRATRIKLVSEQGFGDSLQYLRFLLPLHDMRLAAGLRGGVCLMVEPPLVDLCREGLGWLRDPPEVLAVSSPEPGEHEVSLLDLPGRLGLQQLPLIRTRGAAYLRSPLWAETTCTPTAQGSERRPLQVGLVSAAGRPGTDAFCIREFQKRTLPMAIVWRLLTELGQRGVSIVDLQFGPEAMRHRALGLDPLPAGLSLAGFAETARLVHHLDLVITVDTAMAHLMGAMGRRCWVLLPWSADPRWLSEGGATPWYPTLRLFRQPLPGDWHGAVDELLDFLISCRFNTGSSQ